MDRNISYYMLVGLCCISFLPSMLQAQELPRISDTYVRVAEIGEIADSVNVWGDVGLSGRYIVPEGTNLPDLISFSRGYSQNQGRESNINWAKTLIEVKVSRYLENNKLVEVAFFRYQYHDPEPVEMFEYELQNNDIVTLQVKRKPALADYVGVIAPVVSVIATSILLIENLRGN